MGHDLVALPHKLFSFYSMLIAVFLPFIFSVALHNEPRTIKNQDWRDTIGNQHLKPFLTVLDQFSSASTIAQIHSTRVCALMQPTITIDSDCLSSVRFNIFGLGDGLE